MSAILAGDIGGTKTLLKLIDAETRAPLAETRYDSRAHATFDEIVRDFLPRDARVAAACFAVAGPILDGSASVTNLPWKLESEALQRAFSIPKVVLVNDFYAVAMGVPLLGANDFVVLNPGERVVTSPIAILGAGTGLGEAILLPDHDRGWRVVSSEGGHADFAPTNDEQVELLRFLLREHHHVSVERVVSGIGITNIYRFLLERAGQTLEASIADVPAHVAQLADAGDALAQHCLEIFVAIYGAEAGNLALKVLARGGVFLAGGIAAKHIPRFTSGSFVENYTSKGRFRELLQSIPVYLITNAEVGLIGAIDIATRAAKALQA